MFWNNQTISLEKIQSASGDIEVFDCNNKLIASNNLQINSLDEVSPYLTQAFVSIEDKKFFEHNGVDFRRIVGALINNIKGKNLQGASTITQQLVKNTHLTSSKSFDRKFKEAQLSLKLEKVMSKEDILKNYFNMLYFGSGEYGVKNAAQRFFGKSVGELTLAESAMLAGIVKSPTKYNPINNFENANERKNIVLKSMLKNEKIDENAYNSAKNENIVLQNSLNENNIAVNYRKNAIFEVEKMLNLSHEEMIERKIKIFTYYNTHNQRLLKETIDNKNYHKANSFGNFPTCVEMLVDNNTNGITAFYSNKHIDIFNFRRQLGSTIKPLAVYAPALELNKYNLHSPILDEKMTFGNYSPNNYNEKYYGWTNVTNSIANSLNIPAVKVLSDIGIDNACDFLEQMEFSIAQEDRTLALALGGTTFGNTFLELANGYSTIARQGEFRKNSFVKYVTNANKEIIYDNTKRENKQVFSKETSFLITNALLNTAKVGTAKKLSELDFDVASKTGTVSNVDKNYNNDAFNVAYTTSDVLISWQGNILGNEGMLDKNVTGGGQPTYAAKSILEKLYKNAKPAYFECPESVKMTKFDKFECEQNHKIVLSSQNAPTRYILSGYFDITKLPTEIDKTFDELKIINLLFKEENNFVNIQFDCNKKLCYKIYRKKFLQDEELLYDIKDFSKKENITIPQESKMFSVSYTIVPYYLNDQNVEVIGYPNKFQTRGMKVIIWSKQF
ncbi:MAG: transglycosylase domain-containing protein [Clostridia bacterium]